MTAPMHVAGVSDLLHALGQALAAMSLYGASHPSRAAARTRAHDRLTQVLSQHAPLRITFLDGDVIVDRSIQHDLRGWDWGSRLAAAGVQRIEFESAAVDAETFAAWLELLHAAVGPGGTRVSEATLVGSIRFGPVAIAPEGGRSATPADGTPAQPVPASAPAAVGSALLALGDTPRIGLHEFAARRAVSEPDAMRDELDTLKWIEGETAANKRVPIGEVEAIIRGLSMAMQAEHGSLLPLIALKSADQYTTVHACNVSMLSMGLAEQIGFVSRDVRAIGVAALLHDIGKVRLPDEVLNKPGALDERERAVMRTHTTEGAKLLGERGSGYGLASIVAYEHHIWADGQGGYPTFRYPRTPHFVTRLVQVCDVYDALCTERPYRVAWPRARTLHHMRLQAGRELDYELLLAFFDLIDKAERRQSLPL